VSINLSIPTFEARDRSIPLPTLYHVSPYTFNRPEYTRCVEKAKSDNKHPNGVLGLWASPFPNLFDESDIFGPYVYELELTADSKQVLLRYEDLRGWDMSLYDVEDCHYEVYEAFRTRLLAEGIDVMFVLDGHHNVGEVIIVNLDAIATFERVTEYAGTDAPLTKQWGARKRVW